MTRFDQESQEWLSAHMHFDDDIYSDAGDRVVTLAIAPFIRRALKAGWIDGYFFIRYWQDGGHMRLRLRGAADVLDARLRPALQDYVRGLPPDDVIDLRWVPYTREVNRYGGEDAMMVAEALFESSSSLAFHLIRKLEPGSRSSRLGKALLAMLVLVHAFYKERDGALEFLQHYGTLNLGAFAREEGDGSHWRNMFDQGFERQADMLCAVTMDIWDRLNTGESLLDELDHFCSDLVGIRERLEKLGIAGRVYTNDTTASSVKQAFTWIVPSYVHMMNNRLGLTIPEEAYLAHLIARSLSAPISGLSARKA